MKISKSKVMKIIEEELQRHLSEANPSHRRAGAPGGKGGQFTKRGAGNVYSLSKKAKDNIGKDSDLEVPARGIETSKGKPGSMKFGANTSNDPNKQCGRTMFSSGEDKNPTRSCSDYPKLYELILDEMKLEEASCDGCIQNFLTRIRNANRALKSASDPKELKEQEPTQPKSHYRGSPIDPVSRKSASRKKAERTKAQRRRAGVYVEPFSRAEKSLLNPASLSEGSSSNPDKGNG